MYSFLILRLYSNIYTWPSQHEALYIEMALISKPVTSEGLIYSEIQGKLPPKK